MIRRYLPVILIAFFLTAGACCPYYFVNKAGETDAADLAAELQKILDQTKFYPYSDKRSVFDCSNSTALLYDILTAKGYRCEIITGIDSFMFFIRVFDGNVDNGHAWLIAEKEGHKFWIESTLKMIMPPSFFRKYFVRLRFETLEDARYFFKLLGCEDEWAY